MVDGRQVLAGTIALLLVRTWREFFINEVSQPALAKSSGS